MPDDVKDAVKQVIMECGNKTDDEAEIYIRKLEHCRRYQAETWSWRTVVIEINNLQRHGRDG